MRCTRRTAASTAGPAAKLPKPKAAQNPSGVEAAAPAGSGKPPHKKAKTSNSASSRQQPAATTTTSRCHRRSGSEVTTISSLPIEVIQAIGSHLRLPDLIRARLTCKLWAQHLAQGALASIQLSRDVSNADACAEKVMGGTTTVQLRIGGRSLQRSFDSFVTRWSRAKVLHITRITAVEPKYIDASTSQSQRLKTFKALRNLNNITSLTLSDCVFPSEDDLASLGRCSTLTSLTIQTSSATLPTTLPPNHFENSMGHVEHASCTQLHSLISLDFLCHLEFPLAYDVEAGASLSVLSCLTQLVSLVITGSPVTDVQCSDVFYGMQLLQAVDLRLTESSHVSLDALGLSGKPFLKSVGFTLIGRNPVDQCIQDCADDTELAAVLTKLAFSSCMSNDPLYDVLAKLPALTSMDLRGCVLASSGDPQLGLSSLSAATQLTSLRAAPILTPLLVHFPTLMLSWAKTLAQLELTGLDSENCPPGTLDHVQQLQGLRELTLKAGDNTLQMLNLPLNCVPASVESLSLRFVAIRQAADARALDDLASLELSNCMVEGGLEELQVALLGLPLLKHLVLDDMAQLRHPHFSHIAGLTQLTSLTLQSTGNQHVTNAALGILTTLTRLRKLRWFAGDILDYILEPSVLKAFRNLHLLSISTSMYYRMVRWSALNVLEFLPCCQLETVGP